MGKRLVITEKPSVAKDIVAALGGFAEEDGYWESEAFLVTFAVGHLLELVAPEDLDEKYKRWTLDTLPILPENFVFPMKPKPGTRERIQTIKKLAKREDVEILVNACDAGREGELIFRELVEYLGAGQPVERLWLQSMTKKAIQGGFEGLQPGERYEGLSAAAHCRNYSDWVIGMNATRALTRRLKTRSENQAWSAGRVQTPTLAMLVNRELEVLSHVPVPFWRVKGAFAHAGETYDATWFDPNFKSVQAERAAEEGAEDAKEDRILDEATAQALVARLAGKPAVAAESRKPSREAAPPLLDLTSLQREANRRFGWSAKRTLNAAQRCYEAHKILTYPRTDAKALPTDYRPVVDDIIDALKADARFAASCRRLQADGLQNTGRIFDDSKITDHFAIIPTGEPAPASLGGDDARLYDLVTRRFLAAFHPPALWSRVERITTVDGESFRSRSKVLQVPGWREVLGDNEGGAGGLSPLVPGQDQADDVGVQAKGYEVLADETKPAPRINEARLLSLMENAGKYVEDEETAEAMKDSGIGTPATRADIIENLIGKGYVLRAGKALKPSVKGIRLIDILRRMHADRLASPALTGELERHMAEVEHGRMAQNAFMEEIYEYAREIVELTKGFEFEELFPDEEVLGQCPLCARPVYERSWFYRCKEPEGLEEAKKAAKEAKKAKKKDAEIPVVEDCPFRVWKDKNGRYIDPMTVRELLADGRSRPLDGFATRQGRTYRGVLVLHDGEVEVERMEGGEEEEAGTATPEYDVNDAPVAGCPTCQSGQIMETRSTFVCSHGLEVLRALGRDDADPIPVKPKQIPEGLTYCPALLPRTVCKREITREEAEAFFGTGKTEVLTDFISKRGRPFSATLFMKDNGRHGFEFPPRGGDGAKKGKAAGAEEGAAGAEKAPAKKKAAAKKAPAPKKKAAAKKAPATKKKATTKKKASTRKKAEASSDDGASAPA
jgi:DNA topoisomerase-3